MNISAAWSTFDFKIAFFIFIAYIIVDGMYACYTLQVTKRKPYSSATIGALMHFLLAVGVLNYVQNFLYLLPLALGSWIGTFLVVKKEEKLHM
jgi:uncharacterized protein YebE (UPF0316 family)